MNSIMAMGIIDWLQVVSDIATVIIALSTSVIAVVVAYKQNKIHKNSYKPYCDICCVDYTSEITIKIKNNGTGVMTITSFEVCDNNNNITYRNLYSCIPEDIPLTHYSVDITGRSIAPNGMLVLLGMKPLKCNEYNIDDYKNLRRELKKFTLKVEFLDMYGKPHKAEKNLSLIYGERRRLSKEEYNNKKKEEKETESCQTKI